MLKILIAGKIATPKVKKLWSHISNSLQQDSIYAKVGKVIPYLSKLQQDDTMAGPIQNELTTNYVNFYPGQLGETWSKVEGMLHY